MGPLGHTNAGGLSPLTGKIRKWSYEPPTPWASESDQCQSYQAIEAGMRFACASSPCLFHTTCQAHIRSIVNKGAPPHTTAWTSFALCWPSLCPGIWMPMREQTSSSKHGRQTTALGRRRVSSCYFVCLRSAREQQHAQLTLACTSTLPCDQERFLICPFYVSQGMNRITSFFTEASRPHNILTFSNPDLYSSFAGNPGKSN